MKTTIKILIAILIFSVGLFAGDNLEIQRTEKQKEYSDIVKTTVAVVNLDEGAINEGKKINYASAIIDTLGSEYVLVSSQASKAGFESGQYGAILTFPEDFSDKVLSINDLSPQKTKVKFVVNGNLPEDKYIAIYSKLLDLEMHISQSISYMYISSIYTELHIAQNEVDKVFQNDTEDMIALEKLQLTDYREQLNFSGIPDVPLNLSKINLKPYVNSMNNYISDIDTLYRTDYSHAKSAYDTMQINLATSINEIDGYIDGVNSLFTTNKKFLNDLTSYTTAVFAWNNDFIAWKSQADTISNQANTFISDVNNWSVSVNNWANSMSSWSSNLNAYKNSLNTYQNALDTYGSDILAYRNTYISVLSSWKSDADTAMASIGPWISDVEDYGNAVASERAGYLSTITTYNSNISNLAQYYQDLNDWYDELDEYAHGLMLGPVPQFSTGASLPSTISTAPLVPSSLSMPGVPPVWTNLPTPNYVVPTAPTLPTFTGGSLPSAPGSMPAYGGSLIPNFTLDACPVLNVSAPSGNPFGMITVQDELTEALQDYLDIASSYNPNDYLSSNLSSQVASVENKYVGLLNNVDSKYSKEQQDNITALNAAKDSYESYLMSLKVNVTRVHNTEQQNLSDAVDAFATTKTSSSNENIDLLESFSDKMPNSRIDSVLNKEVVEFTVSPLEIINLNLRTALSENEQSRKKQLGILRWIVLSLLILLSVLLMIQLIRFMIKKRKVFMIKKRKVKVKSNV